MFVQHIALVSQSNRVSVSDTTQIAAALQKQVTRDFSPIWGIPATVDAFADIRMVPPGYWPILIRDDIGQDAAGVHLDENGQPFALVDADFEVPQTCSHELLEMLVDPFGDRLVASDSIKPGQGRVLYLVEVCDPSEAREFGYDINGIRVSDFYTPRYFDPVTSGGVRYSFTGAITKPKQILRGGYLSWQVPATGEWWQATWFGTKQIFEGPFTFERKEGRTWRETIDSSSFGKRTGFAAKAAGVARKGAKAKPTPLCCQHVSATSLACAKSLERSIQKVLKAARR